MDRPSNSGLNAGREAPAATAGPSASTPDLLPRPPGGHPGQPKLGADRSGARGTSVLGGAPPNRGTSVGKLPCKTGSLRGEGSDDMLLVQQWLGMVELPAGLPGALPPQPMATTAAVEAPAAAKGLHAGAVPSARPSTSGQQSTAGVSAVAIPSVRVSGTGATPPSDRTLLEGTGATSISNPVGAANVAFRRSPPRLSATNGTAAERTRASGTGMGAEGWSTERASGDATAHRISANGLARTATTDAVVSTSAWSSGQDAAQGTQSSSPHASNPQGGSLAEQDLVSELPGNSGAVATGRSATGVAGRRSSDASGSGGAMGGWVLGAAHDAGGEGATTSSAGGRTASGSGDGDGAPGPHRVTGYGAEDGFVRPQALQVPGHRLVGQEGAEGRSPQGGASPGGAAWAVTPPPSSPSGGRRPGSGPRLSQTGARPSPTQPQQPTLQQPQREAAPGPPPDAQQVQQLAVDSSACLQPNPRPPPPSEPQPAHIQPQPPPLPVQPPAIAAPRPILRRSSTNAILPVGPPAQADRSSEHDRARQTGDGDAVTSVSRFASGPAGTASGSSTPVTATTPRSGVAQLQAQLASPQTRAVRFLSDDVEPLPITSGGGPGGHGHPYLAGGGGAGSGGLLPARSGAGGLPPLHGAGSGQLGGLRPIRRGSDGLSQHQGQPPRQQQQHAGLGAGARPPLPAQSLTAPGEAADPRVAFGGERSSAPHVTRRPRGSSDQGERRESWTAEAPTDGTANPPLSSQQQEQEQQQRAAGGPAAHLSAGSHKHRPASLPGQHQVGVRRAYELPPGTLDPGLREALARAAVANAATLASGGSLPDADWGYARIVAKHREAQHKAAAPRQDHDAQQRSASMEGAAASMGAVQAGLPGMIEGRESQEQEAEGHGRDVARAASALDERSSAPVSPRSGGGRGLASRPPLPAGARRSALKRNTSESSHSGTAAFSSHGSTLATTAPPPGPEAAAAPGSIAGHTPHPPSHHRSQPHGPKPAAATSARSLFSLFHRSSSARSLASSSAQDAEGTGSASPVSGGRSPAVSRRRLFGLGFGSGSVGAADGESAEEEAWDLENAESVDVRIHCLTFNMGGVNPAAGEMPRELFTSPPEAQPSEGAAGPGPAQAADIYVVATQESGPLAEWEAAVGAALGPRVTHVASESLMAISIALFAVRPLKPHIKELRTSSVATGVGNVLGNKGGVAIAFSLAGASLLLVGAHFAAHDAFVERRNADFHRICAGLFAPPSAPSNASAASAAAAAAADSPVAPPPPAASSAAGSAPPSKAGSADSGRQPHARRPSAAELNGGAAGGRAPAPPHSVGPGASTASGGGHTGGGVLSRFGRGSSAGGVPGGGGGEAAAPAAAAAAEGDSAVADGGEGEGDADSGASRPPSRAITRTLSSSSCASARSTVSVHHAGGGGAAPKRRTSGVSRSGRSGSFWSGASFAAAARRSTALLAHWDVVLWMGDLNYRIAGNPEVIKYALDAGMTEVLAANDQLHAQQRKGKVLQGFSEQPITFPPTFKFLRASDAYDLRRTPAWTDRVLWAAQGDPLFADLRPLYYTAVASLRSSDHRPVVAGFELSLSPQHADRGRGQRHKGCVIS